MVMPDRRITRVKSLEIKNFRGFGGNIPPLNTDADIVLLTGPNGYGKTSFLDALYVLLTGDYFAERRPLTFYDKPTGLIRAEVERAPNPLGDVPQAVSVTIKKDGKEPALECHGIRRPYKIPPSIVGRASFFFQDLFGYLFDEAPVEEVKETLRGFLVPQPEVLSKVQTAAKDALNRLKNEESRLLTRPGIPSETEIVDRRRHAAKKFVQAWNELTEADAEEKLKIPRRSDQWLFLIQSDNLRKGWERELRNLVEDCRKVAGDGFIAPEPDASVSDLFRLLEKLLNQTKELLARPPVQEKQSPSLSAFLQHLSPESADELTIDPGMLATMKKECAEQTTKIVSGLNILQRMDAHLKHFQNPFGPGLLELLQVLREQGQQWLTLPGNVGNDDSSLPAPPDVLLEWLSHTMEMYYADGKGLDEYLAEWLEQVRELRHRKKAELEMLQKRNQDLARTVEISEQFLRLADQEPRFKKLIEQARKQGRKYIDQQTVWVAMADDTNRSSQPSELQRIIEKLEQARSAVRQWREVEDEDARRLESLGQAKNLEPAIESLNAIKKALDREKTARNSVLAKALNDLPRDVEARFAELVNNVLDYFCRVQGMDRIVLTTGKVKARVSAKSKSLPSWDVALKDGRGYTSLSTGQKVQLGLALMFSLNMALDSLLPHDIIALDDATTALDMAQLPRMAVLLRQMAYQPTDGLSVRIPRRQLFIASHHEDLTNRLLDYLIPPENRSLHILNFTNWEPSRGPEIEVLKVEPAFAASAEKRKGFGHLLQSLARIEA